jgi:hypothetical protein
MVRAYQAPREGSSTIIRYQIFGRMLTLEEEEMGHPKAGKENSKE